MNQSILLFTAASLGLVHTILGPDHYIPFIAISKAKNWSFPKTLKITALCGLGHVLGSVALGLIGVSAGIALENLEIIESLRGTIAAYLLIGFGLIYTIYGIRRIGLKKSHTHIHVHEDGTVHTHLHKHKKEHSHVHSLNKRKSVTPWVLFIIFVFGPCEVLIPVLMYPAAQSNYGLLVAATVVFAFVTILTMVSAVALALQGFKLFQFKGIERYVHVLAGALILICGVMIQFLGV